MKTKKTSNKVYKCYNSILHDLDNLTVGDIVTSKNEGNLQNWIVIEGNVEPYFKLH